MRRVPMLLFAASAVALRGPAESCDCVLVPGVRLHALAPRQRIAAIRGASRERATAIVLGLVTRVDLPPRERGSYELSVGATIRVVASWKVATESEITVETGVWQAACGYPLQVGQYHLLFLTQPSTELYLTSSCSGNELGDSAGRVAPYLPDLGEPLVAYQVPRIGE
jgi:hypothetical protein